MSGDRRHLLETPSSFHCHFHHRTATTSEIPYKLAIQEKTLEPCPWRSIVLSGKVLSELGV
jgi:hypothetical protein